MIGLRRGTVRLVPHQPGWEAQAAVSAALLARVLGDTAVEICHVGSTAIPTIGAKPILDLAVGVRELSAVLPHTRELERLGICLRPGSSLPGELLFVIGDEQVRTHHIHVVLWCGPQWTNYLNFRDYLTAFPERAACYEACKRELARRYPGDRARYTAEKEPLVCRLLAEAAAWRRETALDQGGAPE